MKNQNTLVTINLFVSVATLSVVYFLQYILGMQPCEMCIHERYPYFILILLCLISLICIKLPNKDQIKFANTIKYLSLLIIFAALIYSIMHVGIERGFIEGFSECSGFFSNINDADSLLLALEKAPLVRCNDPVLLFNFISIAESNLVVLALLLFINTYLIFQKK